LLHRFAPRNDGGAVVGTLLVIASEAKQSRPFFAVRSLDCFVASLLAMTERYGLNDTPQARGEPSAQLS
jgi:hypothetical protein